MHPFPFVAKPQRRSLARLSLLDVARCPGTLEPGGNETRGDRTSSHNAEFCMSAPGTRSVFRFITKVSDGVEVGALCSPFTPNWGKTCIYKPGLFFLQRALSKLLSNISLRALKQ